MTAMRTSPHICRKTNFCFGASVVAIALAIPAPVLAECAPSSSQPDTPVSCTGSTTQGYTITTNASPLTVASDASVSSSTGPALRVAIPAAVPGQRGGRIAVKGAVTSTVAAGIDLTAGAPEPGGSDPYGSLSDVIVAAGGSVSGYYGIDVRQTAENPYGLSYATLDNAGTITGSSGIALHGSGGNASFQAIINRASGHIGAIAANATIVNAGTIDGGALSAVAHGGGTIHFYGGGLTNSGTITASGAAATLVVYDSPITNSGTISNTGSGAAISDSHLSLNNLASGKISASGASVISTGGWGTITNAGTITNTGTGTVIAAADGTIRVTNAAGGTMATAAGRTAIAVGEALELVNQGTITGDIVIGKFSSTVDSSTGIINGSVRFGAGNDTLVATLKDGTLYTGVMGLIDGGTGTNTLQLRTTSDGTLSSALALPLGFGKFELDPAAGTTLTLAGSFPVTDVISFNGPGTLVNAASITRSGLILKQRDNFQGGTFRNEGTIIADYAFGASAIQMNAGSIANTGTIITSIGAVRLDLASSFANSGTIRAADGTAVLLNFDSCNCSTGTNSGTIEGGRIGLRVAAASPFNTNTFVNTGTISSRATAVDLGSGITFENRAGGVISGGGLAIDSSNGRRNNTVYNAGTINGNVYLAGFTTTSPKGNTFVAVAGGVLNGDLTLGATETLLAEVSGAGTSGYAGINGTVHANGSALRYTASADADATLSSPAGFASVTYQVASGATLTLGSNGTFGTTVTLAGTGNAVLNGDVATTNAAALTTTTAVATTAGADTPTTALSITNDRSLAARFSGNSANRATVDLTGSQSSFINNGTVSITNATDGTFGDFAAVAGNAVVNNGTITASNATGVITGNLINSGTITSNANAVQFTSATISNSGAIVSTGGVAIRDIGFQGYSNSVTNLAHGTITGVGTAVQMGGGLLSNAGKITGDVDLGYAAYSGTNATRGLYVANGGTIAGNLTFGAGDDLLIETGAGLGVSGRILGGGGNDWIGHQRSGTATVSLGSDLPASFSGEFVAAVGPTTQVTVQGPAGYSGAIWLAGDGTIVNRLATSGGVRALGSQGLGAQLYGEGDLAGFDNRADVGSVQLATASFRNSATIGSASHPVGAVALTTSGGLTFDNSGTILNADTSPSVGLTIGATAASTVTNSGAIIHGFTASYISNSQSQAGGGSLTIVNTGTITGYHPPDLPNGSAIYAALPTNAAFVLTNSGTITGDITLTGAPVTLVNTGTIRGDISTGYFGAGGSSFRMNGAFAGSIAASQAGGNTLSIGGGTEAAPVAFRSVSGIARATQSSGFATLAGSATFDTLVLSGGRLVGLAGSALRAGTITVGRGATFGSAGTVNGNITVSGTLSPGASAATMTVNGNVTLASGSLSLFEITATGADKLNITGKLDIQPGSTLQIVASSPIKAGTKLDLISASGGVSGTFDTVTGITGKLRTLANGDLGLLVQFVNPAGFNPQVRRAIDYVNDAMAASTAPDALFPALGALQDSNAAPIAAAFARLTPEPYADVLQVGTETALSLAAQARLVGADEAQGDRHLFSFGQILGSLRQFDRVNQQGINAATINGYGTLGGLGLGGEGFAVAAYVGWIEQDQSIAALGASTRARGVVGGVAVRVGGTTRITLSANYDSAHALTRRAVPDAGTIAASYHLPTWSFDASLSHALPLRGGWLLRPQLGTTWVRTRHDAIAEAGGHPFALTVDAASRTQGFIDGGLGFETAPDAQGPWRGMAKLGARYRVRGGQSAATAALAGYTPSLTAFGMERNWLDMTVDVGVQYRLSPRATLFGTMTGELGNVSKRESITTGVLIKL